MRMRNVSAIPNCCHSLTDAMICRHGYIRLQNDRIFVLIDVARIGLNHSADHARVDLSFEPLDDGRWMIVKSETSVCEVRRERPTQRERQPTIHSSGPVRNSSGVGWWRARPLDLPSEPGVRPARWTARKTLQAILPDGPSTGAQSARYQMIGGG